MHLQLYQNQQTPKKIYKIAISIFLMFLITILLKKETYLPFFFESPHHFTMAPFLSKQIEEDLQNISTSIATSDIDKAWGLLKNQRDFIRYKYVDQILYYSTNHITKKSPRKIVITNALKKILKKNNDLDCIVYLGDQCQILSSSTSFPISCPIFSFTKKKEDRHLILIPDCEALNPLDRKYLQSIMKKGAKKNPWESKKEILFWRGSPTGVSIENHPFKTTRIYLTTFSRTNPTLIDAAIVNFSKELQEKYPKASYGQTITPEKHLSYKYLIDVDGNSCCFSRTFWILLSNSLMFKQTSDHIQWFYKGLIPYEHYIPIDVDLNNLLQKIEFCKANDEKMKMIAMKATDFALSYLQYENNLEYLSCLLEKYSQRMSEKPKITKEDQKIESNHWENFLFSLKSFLRKRFKNQPIASQELLYQLSEISCSLTILKAAENQRSQMA